MNQLTVRELMEKLGQCNPDALVFQDGCDCTGETIDVEDWAKRYPDATGPIAGNVLLERNP